MGRFELKKLGSGERFSLAKSLGLDKISAILSFSGADLDVQAWLLNEDGIIVDDAAFVFYNSENRTEPFDRAKFGNKRNYLSQTRPTSSDGAVLGSKDEQTGGQETVDVCLSKVSPKVSEILISATVYNEEGKSDTFGNVTSAKITVYDEESGDALCEYDLANSYSNEDAVVVARFFVDEAGEWQFEGLGNGYSGGLNTLVEMYAE